MTEPGDMSGELPNLTDEQTAQLETHRKSIKLLMQLQKDVLAKSEQLAAMHVAPDSTSMLDARFDMFLDFVLGPIESSPQRIAFEIQWHKHLVSIFDRTFMQVTEARKVKLVTPDKPGGLIVPGRG